MVNSRLEAEKYMTHEDMLNEIEIFRNIAITALNINITTKMNDNSLNEPFCDWCDKGWPQYIPAQESGIYLMRWPKDVVVYIGKATENNMGAEIWGKFKTPKILDEQKNFYQSCYLSETNYPNISPELRQAICHGKIFLTTVVINYREVSSLLEVYLQTVYQLKMKELPVLNKRIG